MKSNRMCAGCGAPMPPDAPAGLCPHCLLRSEAPTCGTGATDTRDAAFPPPIPGQMFGDYRILRLLGQGGMGTVFEAEHAETGRLVALKVMNHALASDQDRKRFLREGRLAASVNHPNVVYIHGSEEICGVPVITMELVRGGTIKDRLKKEGPLPAAAAVEMTLQLVAGLEAAHHAGVLHRDIKPANCFVNADGTVKVGDFGLSISTVSHGESLLTDAGSLLGTPAYASPEQLRGEELDARSDIYSVGATLYHSMTGSTPFAAADFVKLITEVLDKQPTAPHLLRPEIRPELSRVIQRCLAKDRKARFQSYAELRDALLPFRAEPAPPAKPARRFLASLVDEAVAYGPNLVFLIYWNFDSLDKFMVERTLAAALLWAPFWLWGLLYYSIAEGLWGAALGKYMCGLRVADPEGLPPGLPRALLRTFLFQIPYILPPFLLMGLVSRSDVRTALAQQDVLITDWLWLPLLLLLFVTMRRSNGYAALHDLGSRTRVIVRPRTQARSRLANPAPADPTMESAPAPPFTDSLGASLANLGPYQVRASLWQHGHEELLLALDPALRRQVWIHRRPLDAAPLSPARRDLSRAARLRWLNGGRTETTLWDAYDAVEGRPLWHETVTPASWHVLRFWLLDLAEELAFALKHPDDAPALAMDRVWIASSGHAVLLDFPCPGLPSDAPPHAVSILDGLPAMQRFLDQIAQVTLWPRPGSKLIAAPAPLHTRSFLASLTQGTFESSGFIVGNLHSLVAKPARVTRAWRAASLALVPALMLGVGIPIGGMLSFERIRWERAWNVAYPGKPALTTVSNLYLSALGESPESPALSRDAELTRTYLAHHFRDIINDDAAWTRPGLLDSISEPERYLLKQAVTGNSTPTPTEIAEAERVLPDRIKQQNRMTRWAPLWILLGSVIALGVIFGLVELTGMLVFRQSLLLRLFGLALADRTGQPAPRPRLFLRWSITWGLIGSATFLAAGSVALVLSAGMFPSAELSDGVASATSLAWILGLSATGMALAAALSALLNPCRGLPDRLAGTWVVPD